MYITCDVCDVYICIDCIISLSDPADSIGSGSIVPLGYVEHLPIFLRMPISTYMSVFLFIHLSIHIDPSSYPYPSNQQSSMHPCIHPPMHT